MNIKIIKSICKRIFLVEEKFKATEVMPSDSIANEIYLNEIIRNNLSDELTYLNYILSKLLEIKLSENDNKNLN